MALVAYARNQDWSAMTVPFLVLHNPGDEVVDAERLRAWRPSKGGSQPTRNGGPIMSTVQIVLIALGTLLGLGVIAHAVLVVRTLRSTKKPIPIDDWVNPTPVDSEPLA
ncbi:MAG: hypothetical protein JRJ84_01285 [Deltaproteobacteria bacterium]|nr:hypothetical protein [Deltaproteobacteria bacterium]